MYERQINTYFASVFTAFQQEFRDFVAGIRGEPPSFGICAPNSVAAIEENMEWMQRQRYDAKQLGLARDEARATLNPSPLLSLLAWRAGGLDAPKPQRASKSQPSRGEVRRGRSSAEDQLASLSSRRAYRIIANISGSRTDEAGKMACRFYFGADVLGTSCNRTSADCRGSPDAGFWGKRGLSRELVYAAFNSTDSRLVPYDGGGRDGQRRGTSSSRGPSSSREGHTDYRRRSDDQSSRERSRSLTRRDDELVTRDQVATATIGQRSRDRSVRNSGARVARNSDSRSEGGTGDVDRGRSRSQPRI